MKYHQQQSTTPKKVSPSFSRSKRIGKLIIATTTLFTLSGCLIISPYWNQEFASHTNSVPLQAFTTSPSEVVNFQCAKASHGGLYPFGSSPTWINITNITSAAAASYDPSGGQMYGAGTSTVLPASCWRQDPANSIYYTAVRARPASDSSTAFVTFNKAGLECLGRENGKLASWFGGYIKNCYQTYSNSNTAIPYVIIRANT